MGINDIADLPELKELGAVLEERERLEMEDGADSAEPGREAVVEAKVPVEALEGGSEEGAP
jgi:hypothetical protein